MPVKIAFTLRVTIRINRDGAEWRQDLRHHEGW